MKFVVFFVFVFVALQICSSARPLRRDVQKVLEFCTSQCSRCGGVGEMEQDECICTVPSDMAERNKICLATAKRKAKFLSVPWETETPGEDGKVEELITKQEEQKTEEVEKEAFEKSVIERFDKEIGLIESRESKEEKKTDKSHLDTTKDLQTDRTRQNDISVASRTHSNPKLLTQQQNNPELLTQQQINPELLTQQKINPELLTQEQINPELLTQQKINPELLTQQQNNPELLTQQQINPELLTQQQINPEFSTQENLRQDDDKIIQMSYLNNANSPGIRTHLINSTPNSKNSHQINLKPTFARQIPKIGKSETELNLQPTQTHRNMQQPVEVQPEGIETQPKLYIEPESRVLTQTDPKLTSLDSQMGETHPETPLTDSETQLNPLLENSHSSGVHRDQKLIRPVRGSFLDPIVANVFERQPTERINYDAAFRQKRHITKRSLEDILETIKAHTEDAGRRLREAGQAMLKRGKEELRGMGLVRDRRGVGRKEGEAEGRGLEKERRGLRKRDCEEYNMRRKHPIHVVQVRIPYSDDMEVHHEYLSEEDFDGLAQDGYQYQDHFSSSLPGLATDDWDRNNLDLYALDQREQRSPYQHYNPYSSIDYGFHPISYNPY